MNLYDQKAEMSLLGSIAIGDIGADVFDMVDVSDFWKIENQSLFQAGKNLHDKSIAIDLVTLRDEIDRMGRRADCPPEYIVTVCEYMPSAASWKYYANIVIDKRKIRDMIRFTEDVKNTT